MLEEKTSSNFIERVIEDDLKKRKHQKLITRFPPEPNGYLHIGHSKSICLNFGLAKKYNGQCHLRFDDTNPSKESSEYVQAIKEDIQWLGFDWGEHLYFASDYFVQLYQWAIEMIKSGKAYVCELNAEQMREYRGTLTEPGRDSPYRLRSIEDNLAFFEKMKHGECKEGECVLRAKIDMTHPNVNMRDPVMYRIMHVPHHRTGETWCIYPMYDFTHGQSDSIEGITHSLCTLEFEAHRPLYDWYLDALEIYHPQQMEFARLSISHTIMSKRRLLRLVEEGFVDGWDDPRMPTIAGMRRRGYPPAAIRDFCERIGIAKANSVIDMAQLEFSVRDALNTEAPRVMCVLRPLKVVIENYPLDKVEELDAPYFPKDVPKEGSRFLPFSKELFIESDDFMEVPSKGYHRLSPGEEVRLRYAYTIRCEKVIKDLDTGRITELRCVYDPETLGRSPQNRKIKGVIHWVSAKHSIPVEVRLYDRLFTHHQPDLTENFLEHLNPEALTVLQNSQIEPSLSDFPIEQVFQFERQGYFCGDSKTSASEARVFNRTVPLRDSWAKRSEKAKSSANTQRSKATQSLPSSGPSQADILASFFVQNQDLAFERDRLVSSYGLSKQSADRIAQVRELISFFEEAYSILPESESLAKWILNELMREMKDSSLGDLPFDGKQFGQLVALVEKGDVSGRIGKTIFQEMVKTGCSPQAIIQKKGLQQIDDPEKIQKLIEQVLNVQQKELKRYQDGETNLFGFFVGQVMKAAKGKANPKMVNQLLRTSLDPS